MSVSKLMNIAVANVGKIHNIAEASISTLMAINWKRWRTRFYDDMVAGTGSTYDIGNAWFVSDFPALTGPLMSCNNATSWWVGWQPEKIRVTYQEKLASGAFEVFDSNNQAVCSVAHGAVAAGPSTLEVSLVWPAGHGLREVNTIESDPCSKVTNIEFYG